MSWLIDPRVCEVIALRRPEDLDGTVGSGFALNATRILTARHVASPTSFKATSWLVRPIGSNEWVRARPLAQSSGADIALLEVGPGLNVPMEFSSLRIGRLQSPKWANARAAGFPNARVTRKSSRGFPIRDPEDLRGDLRPASAALG